MTPAAPETYVVEVNPQSSLGYTMTPVIGWLEEEKRPVPVTLHGRHTLVGACAVLFPGGMVHDPVNVLAFDSAESWLESNPGVAKRNPPVTRVSPPSAAKAPSEPERQSGYDIEWIDKPFKSNSFWHYDDGDNTFVFMVEGGNEVPKASTKVAKIKRDDYMVLKKEIDVMSVHDIMNADPFEAADPEEEEVDEDEDDDADGLI